MRAGFRGLGGRTALIGALAVSVAAAGPASAADRVTIDAGVLQGVAAEGTISFKGVPYAKPPVGVWRWRPPQRPEPWAGVRPADRYGCICMQKVIEDNGVGRQPASEDCLTLNVFTPQVEAGAHLPVMVWVHGGGLINGSGTADLYDGSKLAEQGVVVLTFNYRLGRFGFFAHPALTAETPKTYLANYGLMDQIAVLQWVQRNITAFGGDPNNVTVFGESAGGVSVNRLMMIREAQGLFHKAIVQSGAGRERGRTLVEAEADGAAFAAKLGVGGNDPAALRAIPADAIVAAGDLDLFKGDAPILDGRLLTEDAVDAFGRGRTARVSFMIGSNSLEIPAAYVRPALKRQVRGTAEQTAAAIKAYGAKRAYNARIVTDVIFGEPARALARDHAISGHPTWLYRFSVVSSGAPKGLQGGAVHASDRQYVFQTLQHSLWPTDARDAALARTISAYWVAFAKTGDPNGVEGGSSGGEARPHWPRYDPKDQLMDFTNDGPVAKATPDAPVLDVIAERYRQPPPAR
jgi:para-nitrobenzyl esterase